MRTLSNSEIDSVSGGYLEYTAAGIFALGTSGAILGGAAAKAFSARGPLFLPGVIAGFAAGTYAWLAIESAFYQVLSGQIFLYAFLYKPDKTE